MRYILDDEEGEKEAFFNKLEVLGNAMYLTATQFKMSKTILHNLDWYTNMLNTYDGTEAELKHKANITKMKEFLVNQCVEVVHTPTRSRSHCRNLLRQLDNAHEPFVTPQHSLAASNDSDDNNTVGNTSSDDDRQGVEYNVYSQQPSTSTASQNERTTTKRRKGKRVLNKLAELQNHQDDPPVKKKQKKKSKKKDKNDD